MASMKEGGEPKIADEGTEAASWVEEEERRLKAEEDAFVAEQEALPPIQRKDALAGWVFKRGGFKSKAYKPRRKYESMQAADVPKRKQRSPPRHPRSRRN